MDNFSNLEKTWDQLLSRDPQTIKNCFAGLDNDSQHTVIVHLREMTTGTGWHPEQVKSASIALAAILD